MVSPEKNDVKSVLVLYAISILRTTLSICIDKLHRLPAPPRVPRCHGHLLACLLTYLLVCSLLSRSPLLGVLIGSLVAHQGSDLGL